MLCLILTSTVRVGEGRIGDLVKGGQYGLSVTRGKEYWYQRVMQLIRM